MRNFLDALARGHAEGRDTWWLFGLLVALTFAVAASQCVLDESVTPAGAALPSASHECHLASLTDWTVMGQVLQTGWDLTDRVWLFRLDHGCTCLLYIPSGVEMPIPELQHHALRVSGKTYEPVPDQPGFPRLLVLAVGVAT